MSRAGKRQRSDAAEVLADRALTAVSSRVPTGLLATVESFEDVSGVVTVGPQAASACRKLSLAAPSLRRVVDYAAYEGFQSSAAAPMALPLSDGFWSWSVEDIVDGAVAFGADAVFSPSGVIGLGDSSALAAVISAGNGVRRSELVTTLAIPAGWLTDMHRPRLQMEICRSNKPIALVVIGQLDPFESRDVALGLVDMLQTCQHKIFLHRVDMTVVQVLARNGLGGSIGVPASLRHTVPQGVRPQTRRKIGQQQKVNVFFPKIEEFRDVEELEGWFGGAGPCCELTGCCNRRITDFSSKAGDDGALACHNLQNWLHIVNDLVARPQKDRTAWLRQRQIRISTAYDLLRAQTRVRSIRPYGSARVWLDIEPDI